MKGLSAEEQKQLLLSVGSHRSQRPLSPVEVGRAFHKALGAGSTLQECADFVHFDGTSMVSRFLRLLALSPDLHHLVDWGQTGTTIAFTAASELARLSSPEDQRKVALAILASQLSASEVKQVIQTHLRSVSSIDDNIAAILRRRPQIEQRYLLIGAITSSALAERLSALTQAARDELLAGILRMVLDDSVPFAARLSIDRFTISGEAAVERAISAASPDFEAWINKALQTRMSA